MALLDMMSGNNVEGKRHFLININDRKIAYCYIRKNACTSFKTFFMGASDVSPKPEESGLDFMKRCHSAGPDRVSSADYRICVLRDPVSRIHSLYKHKFIQQVGNTDIFADYVRKVGEDPNEATFSDLVTKYLSEELEGLDPHVQSQRSHLFPIVYNAAITLENLCDEMEMLIGRDMATKYFANRVNSTSGLHEFDGLASQETAAKLREVYLKTAMMPSRKSLCDARMEEVLQRIYHMDYTLLKRMDESAGVS